MSEATGSAMIVLGLAVVIICIQIAIVRWLFRINDIVKHLEYQSKILEDIYTQAYHTRQASETVAQTVTGTEPA